MTNGHPKTNSRPKRRPLVGALLALALVTASAAGPAAPAAQACQSGSCGG